MTEAEQQSLSILFAMPDHAPSPHPPSPRALRASLRATPTQSSGPERAAERVVLGRRNYLVRHWRGELSLAVALIISGALLWLLVQVLRWTQQRLPLTEEPVLSSWLWVAEVALLMMGVIWWGAGVQRAAMRHLREGGTAMVAWLAGALGLGAFVWVGAFWWLSARHIAPDVWETLSGRRVPARITLEPAQQQVRLEGDLEFGSMRALRDVLDRAPAVRTVQLESRGGRVVEGLALGRLLRDRGLNALVLGECSSACITAFAGGAQRWIGPQARLGLHSAGGTGSTASGVARANADSDLFIAERGVDLQVLEKGAAVAFDQIWFPEQSTLFISRLATDRLR